MAKKVYREPDQRSTENLPWAKEFKTKDTWYLIEYLKRTPKGIFFETEHFKAFCWKSSFSYKLLEDLFQIAESLHKRKYGLSTLGYFAKATDTKPGYILGTDDEIEVIWNFSPPGELVFSEGKDVILYPSPAENPQTLEEGLEEIVEDAPLKKRTRKSG